MTHKDDIAVLKDILDFFKDTRSKGEIETLTRAIAHFAAIEAATGEEARLLQEMADAWEASGVATGVAACRAGAAAITALAASEAKAVKLTEALRDAKTHIEPCLVYEDKDIESAHAILSAALKEAGQ